MTHKLTRDPIFREFSTCGQVEVSNIAEALALLDMANDIALLHPRQPVRIAIKARYEQLKIQVTTIPSGNVITWDFSLMSDHKSLVTQDSQDAMTFICETLVARL